MRAQQESKVLTQFTLIVYRFEIGALNSRGVAMQLPMQLTLSCSAGEELYYGGLLYRLRDKDATGLRTNPVAGRTICY
jgi:hypothetical protein